MRQRDESPFVGRVVAAVFGLLFTSVGGIGFVIGFVNPLVSSAKAKQWVKTPCRIVSAEVRTYQLGRTKGKRDSIEIVYEYEFNERSRRSSQFHFMSDSAYSREKKTQIVGSYKADLNPFCYVNPEKPNQAVLQRNVDFRILWGLCPLMFVYVGGWFLSRAIKRKSLQDDDQSIAVDEFGNIEQDG